MPLSYSTRNGEAGAAVGPDAVAVGADDLAPLAGAAPLGPPLLEGAAGPGAGGAEQGGEEAVEADEVGEALAGGEVVGEAAPPGEVGQVGAVLGGDEGGAERPEDPVVWSGLAPGLGSEAVEDVEGVQLGEAHPGPAFAGEADVGHLCGGEHPVVVEETAEVTVPFGEPTDHGQQPSVEVTPAPTTRPRPMTAPTGAEGCLMSRTLTTGCGPAVGRRVVHAPALGRIDPADSRPPTP